MSFKSMFERIEIVKKKTNKPKFIILCDMVWCGIRYGAGYVDYDVIGFYKLNNRQRKTMLTRGINNKFVKQLNNKEYWHIFNNKNEFNSTFSKFVSRDWLYPIGDKKEEFFKFVKKNKIFFAKPNSGQCGKGIEKINFDTWSYMADDGCVKNMKETKLDEEYEKQKLEKLYEYLVANNLELVEEPIMQHAKMNELNSSSVNTIRMVSVMNENNEVTILTSFIRIGNGKCVDNFNSGGMTAKVDVKTGKIIEEAVNKNGEIFKKHPSSGVKIKDFQIPNWEYAKNIVCEAARLSTNVRYIGWDVAITKDGATLVEGNQFPGHDIYQVAEKMKEGQLGVLPEFEKALYGHEKVNYRIKEMKKKVRI